jgi:hypothetical protein
MKWRSSLIYLVIFLLVSGYYYYFEVIQKKQKDLAASEARRVFAFSADSVGLLSVKPKEKAAVELKRDGEWEIVQPIRADADKLAVGDFINTLSKLEVEREVAAAPDDLKSFGLAEPSLTISFLAGEQKLELVVGDKNPIGDGYYAKTADRTRVFLIAQGNYTVLNKGLDELRRRQLFSFQLEDVAAVHLAWRDGRSIAVEIDSNDKEWKAPTAPEIKIKKSKVDNVIEQIHWMRAKGFLEEGPGNPALHGLESPLVAVTMRLKSGETATLKLAGKKKDEKQVAAISSQLPAVVEVSATILDDLPKDLLVLQDRSLLGFKSEEVKQVIWTKSDYRGHAVQLDENRWGIKKGDEKPEPMKDSWHIRSLLWDLGDTEYLKKLDSTAPVASKPCCKIELRDAEKELLTLNWDKPPQEGSEPVAVWVHTESGSEVVSLDAERLRRIDGDIDRLSGSVKSE